MRAALSFELLKARKSIGFWVGTVLLALVLPLMGAAFYTVGLNGGTGVLADKAGAFVVEEGLAGLIGSVSQIAAVACFLGVGVGVVWIFGREHVEGTFSALFAQTVSRRTIAVAKFVVSLGWILAVSLAIAAVTGALAIWLGVEGSDPGLWLRLFVVAGGAGLLGLTTAVFVSLTRSYLAAVAAIIVLIATSQVLVLFSAGEWFPYAVPGLLAVSGLEGVPPVGPAHIAVVIASTLTGVIYTVYWWDTAQVV